MEDEKVIQEQVEEVVDNTSSEVAEDKPEVPEQKEVELIPYEYGDAYIYCHACGKETPVNHPGFINVSGGVTIPLTANNKSHLTLSCANCGNILSLHFLPSVNPPIKDAEIISEEIKQNENISEEDKTEGTV